MDEKQQNFKLQKFSPSSISTYLQCPKLFYYHYVSGIVLPQKQIHLVFGGAVHEAIEGIYNNQDPFPIFTNYFNINKLLDEEKEKHKEYIELGYEMIRNYIKTHPILDKLYGLQDGESELWIKRHLIHPFTGEPSSIPISGRIDRLTNNNKIVEYKTAAKKWSQDDANFALQTMLYNLWYYSEYGIIADETIYIILLKKYKKVGRGETYQVLSNHCTLEDLASTFEEIEIIINKINNHEFDRPPGFHPPWCDCHRYEEALNLNN